MCSLILIIFLAPLAIIAIVYAVWAVGWVIVRCLTLVGKLGDIVTDWLFWRPLTWLLRSVGRSLLWLLKQVVPQKHGVRVRSV